MSARGLPVAKQLEALLAYAAVSVVGHLPFSWASAVGGCLARNMGPFLGVSRRARTNLALALPELSEPDIRRIIRGMWDNLGRTTAELAHLPRLDLGSDPRFRVIGFDAVDRLVAAGRRIVFVSAHIGNWELSHLLGTRRGLNVLFANRAANNPAIERLIGRYRVSRTVPKGAKGARALLKQLQEGGSVGFLIDQKMNDGIAVPFFGRLAMTPSAPAELALRYDAVLLPVRVARFRGSRFEITVEAAIEPDRALPRREAVERATTALNEVVEGWVRDTPEQWFWLHRRWPSDEIAPD